MPTPFCDWALRSFSVATINGPSLNFHIYSCFWLGNRSLHCYKLTHTRGMNIFLFEGSSRSHRTDRRRGSGSFRCLCKSFFTVLVKTIFSLYLCVGTWSQAMHVILHVFKDLSYNKISSLQKTSERCPLFMGNPAICFLPCLLMGCLSQLAPYTWLSIRAVL